ncbi:MAG: hypothetical protein IJ795_02735 [Bacteroidales bacterium]|nr:hypothetical protein [Bacteroidales bacterium]
MKGIPGIITEEGKYIENQVIPCYMTDSTTSLRPVSFMDIAQEMGFRAANVMHFGFDDLIKENKAWVLSRLHFSFDRTPHWRDEVEVATWNRGQIGLFYVRDFTLKGENALVRATSSWLVLDVQGRFACRHADCLDDIPEKYRCDEAAMESLADKVRLPKDKEPVLAGTRTVGYADVDFLGHTNNARYMMWIEELVPFETSKTVRFKDLTINFNHETKPGDMVEIYRIIDGDTLYVEGRVEGNVTFTVKLNYEKI